jgi:uncharacterized repeat protein (TIGR03803 family)
VAGLVQGADGYLYGTTTDEGAYGGGTVFKITPNGTLTTLYSFCAQTGCPDGEEPNAGLIQASNGNFYGTTLYGGASPTCTYPDGCGTIFEITPSGTLTTIQSSNAFGPTGLIQATNGNLYGTTIGGGANSKGTVFEITLGGTLKAIYSFCSQSECTDGSNPNGGLTQATDGNFYGTASEGGSHNFGTVFEITPGGKLTTLYSFCSEKSGDTCEDGQYPDGGVVQDTDGMFYGTTQGSGSDGGCCGTAFSLNTGLGPFVKLLTAVGKPGTAINILGTDLTGATSVTLNGTPAVFTVVSQSLITTTVPAGATTGTVEVVRPNGKGLSNVPFTVLP